MDRPKMLADNAAVIARLAQLDEPHMYELTQFVHALRKKKGSEAAIPNFDPWDAGAQAEVLFLLEAPGPKARNSGFISMNNPDETAKNIFEISKEAGLERQQLLLWNTVPWYIGSDTKIREAKAEDIHQGIESLAELIGLCSYLRAIVLVGKKAQKAERHIRTIAPQLKIFISPHPSPLFVNNKSENRNKLLNDWRAVKCYLS